MEGKMYEIEAPTPFAESLIWQLNRDYYQHAGIGAWSNGVVPHNLTSNAFVGKTYAELIFAFLKDLAVQGNRTEIVYLIELGAGHGRLAFHILQHLQPLIETSGMKLPPYCYILSDIVEENLLFFQQHPQFQPFFEQGILDTAYYDALSLQDIELRHSGQVISPGKLSQPLIAIANYFFDSIPMDLFRIEGKHLSDCSLSLHTSEKPETTDEVSLLQDLKFTYSSQPISFPHYENSTWNDILKSYDSQRLNTYLLFPHKGLQCIQNLQNMSQEGLLLITMDKGTHQLQNLNHAEEPIMTTHGSMSFSVNYHAMGTYCEQTGGKAYFPSYSTFNLDIGCLLFLAESDTFTETQIAFERSVDGFGPDDFTSMKVLALQHLDDCSMADMVGLLRMGAYDSGLFKLMMPHIKATSQRITYKDRSRLKESINQTWKMYFHLKEPMDFAFELGGMLFGLGYFKEAIQYFLFSVDQCGPSPDNFYNRALCYYQLREDALFLQTVKEAKSTFPTFTQFDQLDQLDLQAE